MTTRRGPCSERDNGVAALARNEYGSCHSSSHDFRPGNDWAGHLLLEDYPFRTECSDRVYGLPSTTIGIGNPAMRALPADCLRFVRGEGPEVPALPDGVAARRDHSGNTG